MVIVPALTQWPGVEEVCAWKSIVHHASSVVRLIKTNTLILPMISSTQSYKASPKNGVQLSALWLYVLCVMLQQFSGALGFIRTVEVDKGRAGAEIWSNRLFALTFIFMVHKQHCFNPL